MTTPPNGNRKAGNIIVAIIGCAIAVFVYYMLTGEDKTEPQAETPKPTAPALLPSANVLADRFNAGANAAGLPYTLTNCDIEAGKVNNIFHFSVANGFEVYGDIDKETNAVKSIVTRISDESTAAPKSKIIFAVVLGCIDLETPREDLQKTVADITSRKDTKGGNGAFKYEYSDYAATGRILILKP